MSCSSAGLAKAPGLARPQGGQGHSSKTSAAGSGQRAEKRDTEGLEVRGKVLESIFDFISLRAARSVKVITRNEHVQLKRWFSS